MLTHDKTTLRLRETTSAAKQLVDKRGGLEAMGVARTDPARRMHLIFRIFQRRELSDDWFKHHERIERSKGIDQSVIQQWPIQKAQNEQGYWNSKRLKRERA